MYLKTKRKELAFQTLQEALKHSYESWKMWENFLYVSMDLGQLSHALQAFARLLELRGAPNMHMDV